MRDEKFKHLKLSLMDGDYKYVLCGDDESFWSITDSLKSLRSQGLYFLFRCEKEVSMVVPGSLKLTGSEKVEPNWKAIKIVGDLPFGTAQGLIASISNALQASDVGICAVSTYLTDIFFVKEKNISAAMASLKREGWEFV
jgi:hypothetical protein